MFLKTRIPSLLYGGTERVMWYLGNELVKMGHSVTFLANEGSSCDFAKVLIYDPGLALEDQIPADTDIVHVNDDYFTEDISKPFIVTIHGNPETETPPKNAVFVSKNHAERYASDSYVYNGLDWNAYQKPNLESQRSYFHFLGNAAWKVKNVKGAISIISKSKTEKLYVMGGTRWHPNTFTFSNKISFLGMVDDVKKAQVMNHSKGLLFPVTWNEPFGLAIIESLFYGCPVFGSTYGSLPELVREDVGLLSNSEEELSRAILNADSFSKSRCNEYVVEAFNSRKMALAYLEKYEAVLNRTQPVY
ncbi:glycosyltransferase family 4 protein [Flavobacterium sp. SE-s28]|uniref:Glycosyltransferase family 4 protein n=1 Tax=Flavobacterium silvaticum TaxID=1852020 RepID=A0A972FTV1_9FLAO|nr:glycosyltransferase family 4 protein [Flavobacterium silvaticum]